MSEFKDFYTTIKAKFMNEEHEIPTENIKKLSIYLNNYGQLTIPKSLKYFKRPSSYPLNLNLGFEDFKFREEEYFKCSLNYVEKYLMENNGKLLLQSTKKLAVCTSRNTLRIVLYSPYIESWDNADNWTVRAIKFKDVLYLVNSRELAISKTQIQTYHTKFQQYCFSDSPYDGPKTDEPVDDNVKMACILRKTMGNFDLFYSSEVIGVESENEIKDLTNEQILDQCHFVATKLFTQKENQNLDWKRHKRILEWWMQSYLSSEDIYWAYRSKNGFVTSELQQINFQELVKNQKWKPEVCKRFLHDFLTKVEEKMSTIDNPYIVYEFKYESKRRVIKYRTLDGKSDEGFLSEEFIQYIQMV